MKKRFRFFSENEELEEVKNLFQKFNDENYNNDLYYFDMDDSEGIDLMENVSIFNMKD